MNWKCKWFGHDWEPYGHRAWVTDSSERIYAKVTIPLFGVCKRCGKIRGVVGSGMVMEYDYTHMTTLLRDAIKDYNTLGERIRK